MEITAEIKREILKQTIDETERSAFFENRYPHHALCLLDGIIKKNNWQQIGKIIKDTNCQTREIKITPKEEDYQELKEILQNLTRSW